MLTQTVEYALRAATVMALQPDGAPVLGRDLATRSDVPADYLAKILLELKRAGIVAATRGAKGGYCLNRPADGIRLVEIVKLFDPQRAAPGCLLGSERPCDDRQPCSAHDRWREVRRAFVDFLEETTIADIAGSAIGNPDSCPGQRLPVV